MNKIKRGLLYSKAGGNASKNSKICRLTIPVEVQTHLGVNEKEKEVVIELNEDSSIMIKKIDSCEN